MRRKALAKRVLLALVSSLLGFAVPLGAQEVTFTDLFDLVPDRCFSAPLSTVDADSVDIGIESGFSSTSSTNKAWIASTRPFNTRAVTDTFTVTASAPPGTRIARVHYAQTGTRFLERSTYWTASGSGTLTVNELTQPFSFTLPTLVQTVDLRGQDVESATVSVMISLSARRAPPSLV